MRQLLDVNACSQALNWTAEVCEELNLTYFIDSGTLLSAYRDKNINVYDHDIDVRIFRDEVDKEKEAELVKRLWFKGFRLIVANSEHQIGGGHPIGTGVNLDLKFCDRDGKDVWYFCWHEPDPTPAIHLYPQRFFDNMGRITLLGREYSCPSPIEEYIEYHYGKDWRQFKVSAEDAEETDMTWDYMKDPPCSLSLPEFIALKAFSTPSSL